MGAEQFHEATHETKGAEKEFTPEQIEKHEQIKDQLEQGAELSRVESGEKAEKEARHEALKEAVSVESGSAEKKRKEGSASPAKRRHGVVSKKEREASYKHHMKQLQSELTPSQRVFSKFIHNPVVEKSSEVVGSTIARPNAILTGAVVAFILVLAVYLVSKFYGYTLSGFETIGAFIVGWILGILYDFFKVMITGKKA